jgi:hypothetical protein
MSDEVGAGEDDKFGILAVNMKQETKDGNCEVIEAWLSSRHYQEYI